MAGLISLVENHLKEYLGLTIQGKILPITNTQWKNLLGKKPSALFYDSKTKTTYLNISYPFPHITLFREYYGKLFFRQHSLYKRANSSTKETFSLFMAYYLSLKFGQFNSFKNWAKSLTHQERRHLELALTFKNQHGFLATFYEFGIIKKYSIHGAIALLEEIYTRKSLHESKAVFLQNIPSEKEQWHFLIISSTLSPITFDWIKVGILKPAEFWELAELNPRLTKGIPILSDSRFLHAFQEYKRTHK